MKNNNVIELPYIDNQTIKLIKCPVCGLSPLSDEQVNYNIRFCSNKCRKKDWQEKNLELQYKRNKEWQIKNKDKINDYKRTWYKKIKNKLNQCMSTGIYHSLKGNKKGKHWEDLVEYDFKDLKERLESLFTSEMSWDNYGSYWHIDHIKPVSLFDFNSYKDKTFKDCWALSNLQPLERIENLRKGNKFECA